MALARLGPPVLIVPGNMDHRDVVPDLWEKAGFIVLHRSSFRHKEYGFLGMGGMIARDPRRLGDPNRYYHRDDEVYSVLEKAYQEVAGTRAKIVIVHQPPRGACDILYNGERSGSSELRRFIENYQPDLVLCGHIHEDRGECHIGSTLVVNVGELRRGYGAVIDLNDEITVKWI
ncbi:MAG: Calcineurin-like phosphoesterase superfamily domain protein [Methanosaeta sp. PtaB.Bin005]|nr:MAG: Calcineurin-like phosphoesterase superfamily domain protein [Methanosaeta sp. PtaB.Bin005]